MIARASAGDHNAFRDLVQGHSHELQVHCYRILGSLQDAEDALQETLVSAWRNLGEFGELPAALWLFHQGSTGWGIFMLAWGVMVSSVDNVVKPWLISQGSDLPFILIFFGVLGGALMFGFIGVFIGPTLLAVGYRLVVEWAASSKELASNSVG